MSNMRKILFSNGLSIVNICDDSVFGRNVSIDGGVSYFYVDRNSKKEIEIKRENDIVGGVINNKIVLSENIEIVSSIISKIKLKASKYMSSLYKRPQLIKSNDRRFTDNGIEVLASKNRRLFINYGYDDSKQYYTKYKLVFEKTSGSFRKSGISGLRVEKPNLLTTESIAFFPFDSEQESINCLSYLKTNFAFLLRNINQSDKNFNQYVFDLVPLLSFDKPWCDDLIFKYFNLTEEESDFIIKYKS
jgi:site-specific DNA-methyltransferase (adenine-specific)